MSLAQNIHKKLLSLFKDIVHLRAIDPDRFLKQIQINRQDLESFIGAVSTLSKGDWENISRKMTTNQDKLIGVDVDLLKRMWGSFNRDAQKEASKQFFGAYLTACKRMAKLLKEIEDNFEENFTQERITIYNTRVSHLVILSMVRDSEYLTNYVTYLWGYVTEICTLGEVRMKPYAKAYISDVSNRQHVVRIINQLCAMNDRYSLLKDIGDLRKRDSDAVLATPDSPETVFSTGYRLSSNGLFDWLGSATEYLNIFRIAADKYVQWLDDRHRRNKEMHEWIATRVAILKLELEDYDRDSSEYQKKKETINKWDEMMASYDKKIKEYEDGHV